MLGCNETRADKAVVERMAASMWHRGPDGNGIWVAGPVNRQNSPDRERQSGTANVANTCCRGKSKQHA